MTEAMIEAMARALSHRHDVGTARRRRTARRLYASARCFLRRMAVLALLVLLVDGSVTGGARAQGFHPDDPIWTDPDRLDMPAPAPHHVVDFHDFWINTFGRNGTYDASALNVNTLGDVPASSWYALRHYYHPMSTEALARGPNSSGGPDASEMWTVVAAKTEGKTPGLEIVDARGDRYLLKFDPPGHVEMTSGAEIISTKLLHALGYYVPENYPVRFERTHLHAGPDAVLETRDGEIAVTEARIDSLLALAAHYDDGSLRALASLYLAGEPIGPFLYHGTRPDDGNDIFLHEGRRELRGLRVISAWIDHTDARNVNTLDTVVEEEGRTFVRHHLIDFGSTLGVGPLGPKRRWDGFEYLVDPGSILLRTLTLGAVGLEWAAVDYPDIPAVGRFDAAHFDPASWKPQYPNPAFQRMDAADAFWAAKQIANISDDAIRAIVASADYTHPESAKRVADVLIERRNHIARTYLPFGGGLDRFEVGNGYVHFEDLLATHGLAERNRIRHVIWRPFDNATGEIGPIMEAGQFHGERLEIPESSEDILLAEIRMSGGHITRVYLRQDGAERRVVGLDRH